MDAFYDLACHAFVAKFVGNRDVERHSQRTFVGNAPTGHIFTDDFHIVAFDQAVLSLDVHGELSARFQFCNLFLADRSDDIVHGLHEFAELLAHHAEIALDFLLQHVAFDEIDGFDVHFVEDELAHGLESRFESRVVHRNGNALQRLAHNDAFLLAQREHQRGGLLCQLHAGFEFTVDQ